MAEAIDDTNDVAHAEELRLQGNTAFASKKWKEAIDTYEESLSFDGDSKNSGMFCLCLVCVCCLLLLLYVFILYVYYCI